jgi:hypothetical protein
VLSEGLKQLTDSAKLSPNANVLAAGGSRESLEGKGYATHLPFLTMEL